jgi:hypothetical protein
VFASEKIRRAGRCFEVRMVCDPNVLNLRADSKSAFAATGVIIAQNKFIKRLRLTMASPHFASGDARYAYKYFANRIFSCSERQGNSHTVTCAPRWSLLHFQTCVAVHSFGSFVVLSLDH